MWKPPRYVPEDQVSPPHPLLHPQLSPQEAPLLYHLLMLQTYCQHNLHLSPGSVTSEEPLDLSTRSDTGDTEEEDRASGFVTHHNKISFDESIRHYEEVEVAAKEEGADRHKEEESQESVQQFVERKIKEYKKSDTEFKLFVQETNHKEQDIKRKMSQIKEKYSKINNKIKKLEEKKVRMKRVGCRPVSQENKEPNNNDQDPTQTPHPSSPPPAPAPAPALAPAQASAPASAPAPAPAPAPDTRLVAAQLRDGLRVLLRLDSVLHPGRLAAIAPPDVYGVTVDRERGRVTTLFE